MVLSDDKEFAVRTFMSLKTATGDR